MTSSSLDITQQRKDGGFTINAGTEFMRVLEPALLHLSRRVPGFQYVAVNARSTLVELCSGYAELPARLMSTDTTMMAYSMSKTITAAAVLQLIERGALQLDDPLSCYLPWQPYGLDVTVRQLMSHTAGLPNPIPLRWVHPVQEHAIFDQGAALRTVLSKHGRLVTRPGTRFAYSNIGYWLLGALVEQVTRESFPTYVKNHLLVPLGVSPAGMGYVIADPGRHATGYLERFSVLNLIKPLLIDPRLIDGAIGRWVAMRPHYPDGPAFGGIIGTASAFGKFLQDQLSEDSKVLGPVARASFVESQRTEHSVIPMTLGWHVGSPGPHAHLFKEGAGGGFHSMMRLYPSHGMGTVLMSNATTVNVRRVLDSLDDPLLSFMG